MSTRGNLQNEGVIWVQEQAPAGNWTDVTGHFITKISGPAAALKDAKKEVSLRRKNGRHARVVEKFFRVVPL